MEEYKNGLKKRGVNFTDDIFLGRLDYPPNTSKGETLVTQRLSNIINTISKYKKSLTKDEQIVRGNDLIYEVLLNDGLLFPPASKEMIEKAEEQVQMTLPLSYKEFLQVSNGMLTVYGQLLSANEIDWLRIRDKETMETWWVEGSEPDSNISDSEYFDYEANGVFGGAEAFRVEYLEKCLQIGDTNQISDASLWLLNPVIQTVPDDWEAWVWSPGDSSVPRYRNFKEMMEIRYRVDVASLKIDLLYLEEEFKLKKTSL